MWAFLSLGSVGVGSTLFHCNLLRWGQVLDEAPMLLYVFTGTYLALEQGTYVRAAWNA